MDINGVHLLNTEDEVINLLSANIDNILRVKIDGREINLQAYLKTRMSLLEKDMKTYVIRHSTKGYLLRDNGRTPGALWSNDHTNNWKLLFHSIEEAEQVAKILKGLDGKLLKQLEIVEQLKDESEYDFERYNTVKVVENDKDSSKNHK